MKNLKIIKLYLKFITLEIPNFIQIFSLLTFFTVFLINMEYRFNIILVVSTLLFFYLIEKSFEFLKNQMIDQFSEIGINKLNNKIVLRWWTCFTIIAMIGFSFLAIYFSSLLKPY